MAQLCLGTVQFGLPYGVTNQNGQVAEAEVRKILNCAAASKIELLDTAQAYGNAEDVLARCWPNDSPKRLISKLPKGLPQEMWEKTLQKSLQCLQVSKIDCYLVHSSSDLVSHNGGELLQWLEGLRDRGIVNRIGVSIYDGLELDDLPLDRLQVVQLPLSVYNQQLLRDGTFERLNQQGIAIHVRSVFLQGLLLQSPQDWPTHLSLAFRRHHENWLKFLEYKNISPIIAALAFVSRCKAVEAVLIGVLSACELEQLLHAWNQISSFSPQCLSDWAWESNTDYDPRFWPSIAK